nr:zinc finger, CCHC-type [Tanacetum cinerariifolium]
VKDDPKTFDEAMKSHDVAFWKESIDSFLGNNTWVLADLPPGKDYAQNVKNQSKIGQYRTQDLKSTAKAGSTGIILKKSSNEA